MTLMVWFACRLDAPAAVAQLILPYSSSADPKCWLQSVRKREQSVGDAALNNGNSFILGVLSQFHESKEMKHCSIGVCVNDDIQVAGYDSQVAG